MAYEQAIQDYVYPKSLIQSSSDGLTSSAIHKVSKAVVDSVSDLFFNHNNEVSVLHHEANFAKGKFVLHALLDALRWPLFGESNRAFSWDEEFSVPSEGPGKRCVPHGVLDRWDMPVGRANAACQVQNLQ